MNSVLEQAKADAQTSETVENEALEALGSQINIQLNMEKDIVECEERLKDLKKKHLEISRTTIPKMMEDLNLKSLEYVEPQTDKVFKVKIQTMYSATIKDHEKAFNWLEENGHDGIIKASITLPYGKGDLELAKSTMERLRADGYNNANLDMNVHWQTLRGFVREQIEENGEDLPGDLFEVVIIDQCKLKGEK